MSRLQTGLRTGLLAVTVAAVVSGCASQSQQSAQESTLRPMEQTRLIAGMHYGSLYQRNLLFGLAQPSQPETAWDLTRDNLSLELDLEEARLARELAWLEQNPAHVTAVSQRALPYYHYILEQVLERGMPAEVALIPFIESGYNPFAVSSARAAGPWQFIPGTARNFGLESNWWYDGRRDIVASTDAALNYLSKLNDMFEGDWLLTFAAYNAGEGNVLRAMNRNREANKPLDYWSLRLPAETMRYVPKLLATARVIRDADTLGVELEAIPAEPYFAQIDTGGQLDLSQAAALAEIDLDELKRLNPGFSRWATAPEGPHRLLVPVENADQFQTALVQLPVEERVNYQHYTINSGDTLGAIARRFGTTVSALQQANQMDHTRLRVGQTLLVPAGNTDLALQSARAGSG
ncbi:MAG: transglycosylase SLT domain-containing protein [Nitrincola lacisaponensis]|uniref:Membrane-bound lytic murein transglycosylase D n=1 Tax=Nitrincola lacisaponensis TaxID=267850 RepID=A0A063Y2G8_9GAMM|nr:transglycosylase SLT domain-containing protein [Nitrincola lacisaponensis]KDE39365.1 Membrane-bound lytic murein transglycosylase D precursor [Nitrincola lacisaponensis]